MIKLILVLLTLPINALAQSKSETGFETLCNHLNKRKPALNKSILQKRPVSGAEYTPGIDIHGKAVTSADVSGSSKTVLNKPITIPIQLDLLEQSGVNLPEAIFSEAAIGEVQILGDGSVMFEEKEISDQIKIACEDQEKPRTIETKTENTVSIAKEEHRQAPPNPVPSLDDKIEGQYP